MIASSDAILRTGVSQTSFISEKAEIDRLINALGDALAETA